MSFIGYKFVFHFCYMKKSNRDQTSVEVDHFSPKQVWNFAEKDRSEVCAALVYRTSNVFADKQRVDSKHVYNVT